MIHKIYSLSQHLPQYSHGSSVQHFVFSPSLTWLNSFQYFIYVMDFVLNHILLLHEDFMKLSSSISVLATPGPPFLKHPILFRKFWLFNRSGSGFWHHFNIVLFVVNCLHKQKLKESQGEIKLFRLINPHQNFIELFTYVIQVNIDFHFYSCLQVTTYLQPGYLLPCASLVSSKKYDSEMLLGVSFLF